ncbi:AI-2E family transporter [Ideonella sp. DXS29W]|uniref:AI-2E family transporter n=1 Tax=Ideonella lacteola TaxID=2984193 RepID=A0ABU9BVM2_9BURK
MPDSPSPDTDAPSHRQPLRWLVIVATIGLMAVLLPLYGALMWAGIVALVFRPVQRALSHRWGGRRGLAAAATLSGVGLVVVLPLLAMVVSLAREGAQLAQSVQSGQIDVLAMMQRTFNALPSPLADLLEHFGIGNVEDLQQRVEASAGRVAQFFAGHVATVGQSTLSFVVDLFVGAYVAFFLLRDGDALSARWWAAMPLAEADKRELRRSVATVVRATVKGNLVVALVQGALGGLALMALGMPAALLAGAVMAVLSLLPAVGAALVWLPIALYLLATGATWQGLALIAFGTLVIGLIDNLLRPILVGRDTRLPDWVVLVTTLGGIAWIGVNGFVIGPLLATICLAAWELYTRRRQPAA